MMTKKNQFKEISPASVSLSDNPSNVHETESLSSKTVKTSDIDTTITSPNPQNTKDMTREKVKLVG